MKKWCLGLCVCLWAAVGSAATTYNDSLDDLDPGVSSDGTVDIVRVEVSHTANALDFDITVDGNLSISDWGKFMIGFATGENPGTTTTNAWGRPVYLDSPLGGMNYWIGSWVDGGGGAELYAFNEGHWSSLGALTMYSITPGAQSLVSITVARTDLNLSGSAGFYFDVYSSGGIGTDSAVDALSNPNVSVTAWDQTYTSQTNDTGLSYYSFAVAADVTPSNGPFAGGNSVLVTNAASAIGDGSDVTNVTVGGVAATGILGQGTNWVRFIAPATGSAGVKDIVIQSETIGASPVLGTYTVNPAGTMGGMVIDGFTWTNMAQGFNSTVYAVYAATDGTFYAGGAFTQAVNGAESLQRVARWDGSAWTNGHRLQQHSAWNPGGFDRNVVHRRRLQRDLRGQPELPARGPVGWRELDQYGVWVQFGGLYHRL